MYMQKHNECLYQAKYRMAFFSLDYIHFVSEIFRKFIGAQGQLTESVSPRFLFNMVVIMIYLFVLDD